jgi:hypothetical protein
MYGLLLRLEAVATRFAPAQIVIPSSHDATLAYKSRICNRVTKHNLKVCHLLGVYIVIIIWLPPTRFKGSLRKERL